ncbi:MAG: 50S ribosomal protein L11 methyltransferase [Rhodospirillaceae bacterium]|nr:50S ribosomal protein L11 methyltransferase [Rhodospirillaceae bacterium]
MTGRRTAGGEPADATPDLWQVGFGGPERLVEAAEPLFEGALSVARVRADDGSERWTLEALFDGKPAAAPIGAGLALAAEALGLAVPPIEVARLEPRDWLAENRAALTEIAVGRFRIVPEHRRNDAPPSHLLNLFVDAGPAFGSGRHETTQSCLLLLEEIARERRPRRILDLGAGSGILALAAAQLWKGPVIATDIDPVAVRTARQNAMRNDSLRWIDVRCGCGLDPVRRERPFDLVMANVVAGPLAEFAPAMRRAVARPGRLILSGILSSQENRVLCRYRAAGFRLERRLVKGSWSSYLLTIR